MGKLRHYLLNPLNLLKLLLEHSGANHHTTDAGSGFKFHSAGLKSLILDKRREPRRDFNFDNDMDCLYTYKDIYEYVVDRWNLEVS